MFDKSKVDVNDVDEMKFTRGVRTKGKHLVRILCTDGHGDTPIVGFVNRTLVTWTKKGEYLSFRDYDLVTDK